VWEKLRLALGRDIAHSYRISKSATHQVDLEKDRTVKGRLVRAGDAGFIFIDEAGSIMFRRWTGVIEIRRLPA
jgi:hypothetical protein